VIQQIPDMKNRILYILIILSLQLSVFATNPVLDYIIYNNVKYTGYFKTVFWEYYGFKYQKYKNLFGDHLNSSTACHFFTLDLEISNDSLFITKIYNCNRTYHIDLEKEFPDICKNNKIYAFWFTETMHLGKGKVISSDFINTYENELVLYVNKGRIISEYDIINQYSLYSVSKRALIAFSLTDFFGKTTNNYDKSVIDLCKCVSKNKSFYLNFKTYKQAKNDSIIISKTFKKKAFTTTKIHEKETLLSIEKKKKKIYETYLVFNDGYYYLFELRYDDTLANKTLRRNFLRSIIFARIK